MGRHGTLEQTHDGHWRLRFVRRLEHPPEQVWRAITEPRHLAAWFPTTIEGERAAGAHLRFGFPGDRFPAFDGQMLAFEPPVLMEIGWGPDILRFELAPIEGGTELTLLDTLEQRGKASRDGAGWHTCLDALTAQLAGEQAPRAAMGGWTPLHEHYREAFGPEAATIAPPKEQRAQG